MTDEDQTMQICAYVPVALSRALDRVAKQKGLARARAIEQACVEYVRRETPFSCPGCKNLVMMRYGETMADAIHALMERTDKASDDPCPD